MDTRYWGPSGWKFLHMVVRAYNPEVKSETKVFHEFLSLLPFILPCKFCRKSLQEYYEEDPFEPALKSQEELSKWMYRIHNKVNNKLRSQGQHVPKNPSYESIAKHYNKIIETSCSEIEFPAWDFLFSIAETHPASKLVKTSKPIVNAPLNVDTPSQKNKWNLLKPEERIKYFEDFWKILPKIFPYKDWATIWNECELDLKDRRSLLKSLWKTQSFMCKKLNQIHRDTFQGRCHILKDQRSGCGISSRGKTCRKKKTGK